MLPDADVLGQCVHEALDELVDSATGGRPRVPRGRKKRKPPESRPMTVRVYLPTTLALLAEHARRASSSPTDDVVVGGRATTRRRSTTR